MISNTGFRRMTVLLFVLLAGGLVLAGPVSAFDQTSKAFYEKNPMSEEQVRKTWGKPVSTVSMAGGTKKLYFKLEHNFLTDSGYRFFVIKDGMVLYSGLSQTKAKVKTHNKKRDIPLSRVDQEYFRKNVVTIDKVNEIYGKPMLHTTYPGGGEVYVYETKGSGFIKDKFYRFFIAENGRVIASGATDVIAQSDLGGKKGIEPKYASQLSQIYYQKHKLTGDDIARTWGEPVAVKTISTTMEERFFDNPAYKMVEARYRYFIIDNNRVIASGLTDTIK